MSDDRDRSSLAVPPSAQDHRQGALSAAAVLVMYGDYESPQSAKVYRLIKAVQYQLRNSFGAPDLCFIFRHFPQTQIHPQAQHAAEAAEAAAAQGLFWPMHESLFIHQQSLGNGFLVEYANDLGLDISRFLQDISKQTYADRVNDDIASGHQSGVVTEPALFINGIRYRDRWNILQLMAAIANSSP
ncbi:DsbA family protein [Nodosilinea nodulosa]|uniref:DsbA family protein n=1 Tax=Nodosilinea nodulosa TaxID=416001 RepID=UPI00047467F0|nr:thioredoxin domain-containing protein [Nodosilinea nodulosa]